MDKAGRFVLGFLFTLIGCLMLGVSVSIIAELVEGWGVAAIFVGITVLVTSIGGGVLAINHDL